jgi:hypothetical protein
MSETFVQRARRLSMKAVDIAKSSASKAASAASKIVDTASSNLQLMESGAENALPEDDVLQQAQGCLDLIDYYGNGLNPSSVDADRALHASKAREYARRMVTLLAKESDSWVRTGSIEDQKVVAVFVQKELLQEFVDRALQDKPRGCLPLVMAISTSLLRSVKYPLIAEPSIQRALNQLVTAACRIQDILASRTNILNNKTDMTGYMKRVEVALSALIGIIWRRLSEQPACLERFQEIDDRFVFTVSDTVPPEGRNMDILSALIPMLEKPLVAKSAREALLLAIGMHDSCVDRLIVIESGLIEVTIQKLCSRLDDLLKVMAAAAQGIVKGKGKKDLQSPMSMKSCSDASASSPTPTNKDQNQNSNQKSPFSSLANFGMSVVKMIESPGPAKAEKMEKAKDEIQIATDEYMEILHFVVALATSSSRTSKGLSTHVDSAEDWHRLSSPSDANDDGKNIIGMPSIMDGAMPISNTNSSSFSPASKAKDEIESQSQYDVDSASKTHKPKVNLLAELLQAFEDMFLQRHFLEILLTKREDEVQAAQRIARMTILHLSSHDRSKTGGGALTAATTQCLCRSNTLMRNILVRAGSVSRNVAVTTIQLLSCILTCAPLEQASGLLLEGVTLNDGEADSEPNSPVRTQVLSIAALGAKGNAEQIAYANSLDGRLSAAAQEIAEYHINSAVLGPISMGKGISEFSEEFFDTPFEEESSESEDVPLPATSHQTMMRSTVHEDYIEAAGKGILTILTGKFAALVSFVKQADKTTTNNKAQTQVQESESSFVSVEEDMFVVDPYYCEDDDNRRMHGPILNLTLHKLSTFLSLKFDEQLAVTGLVERCVQILSAMVVVAPPSDKPQTKSSKESKLTASSTSSDLERLDAILTVHSNVMDLWDEASQHLAELPDSTDKMDALKAALKADRPEMRKARLLSRESPHAVKLLESSVVVRELLLEVRASILAVKRLRGELGEFDSSSLSARESLMGPGDIEHDINDDVGLDDSYEEGDLLAAYTHMANDDDDGELHSDDEDHLEFMAHFEDMESALENLVGSKPDEKGDECEN